MKLELDVLPTALALLIGNRRSPDQEVLRGEIVPIRKESVA